MFIIILGSKTISGYIERINLSVTAEIAKPIFIVQNDETIYGNYSDITQIPEYKFTLKNYDEENRISEIDLKIKLEVVSENKIEYEVINCKTNEVILSNNQKSYILQTEANKFFLDEYKVILKSNPISAKESLNINIDAKYYQKQLNVFDINLDKRDIEYEIFMSESDKKYTNKDVVIQIKCNKEVKQISGFQKSNDGKNLTKVYTQNSEEKIVLEDFFNNKKNIKILINNIDKQSPEIIGIDEGKTYNKGLELVYKDNIGIRNIKLENTSNNQSYNIMFDTENKIIDNKFFIVKNNSINPYYITQQGNYTITVTDFAENKIVRHICIK